HVLPWKRYGRLVSVSRLLDLLLLVAATASSLFAVVIRFRFGFSHETARQATNANLPDVARLTEGLLDALYAFGGRALRRRRGVVAIDVHDRPFYGDRTTAGIVGGQKKHGTKHFYRYATAALVHHRHRYTVGLLALTAACSPHEVVAALLAQMECRRLRLRGVVLDSGFDSGQTLLLLQQRGLSYAVPLQRKGKGKTRRNACFAWPAGSLTEVDWVTEKSRQKVRPPAVVAPPVRGRIHLYAFGGWSAADACSAVRAARLAKRWYRKRFGIETSYRQMNQGRATTTRKDVVYRLLLVGLALLLRQVWVWLVRQLAHERGAPSTAWLGELPLVRLLDWLGEALQRRYKQERSIALNQPLCPLEFDRQP